MWERRSKWYISLDMGDRPEELEPLTIDDRGRLLLPAEVRRRLGLAPGAAVLLEVEDGTIRLVPRAAAARRGHGIFADLARGRSLVEELRRERRAEAVLDEVRGTGDRARARVARRALARAARGAR